MRSLLGFLRNMALLGVRIGFGLLLIAHAWHRWRQAGMATEVDHLATHHVPQPELLAWGATVLEAAGGVLLVLGAFVPLVALALLVMNVLVIVWLKLPHGVFHHRDGFEFNLVQALLALVLLTHGSGRAGLDALIFRRRKDTERRVVRQTP